MRKLTILVLVAMMATVALGATGCCCAPCGDLGGLLGDLLGSTTMSTSPGDFSDIPPYPGSRRLDQVAMPGMLKAIFEQSSGGGKFDLKGYSTRDAPGKVAEFYDRVMPENGWSGAMSSGSTSGAGATSQMGIFDKGEDIGAMIYADTDTDTGETMILIMRFEAPESQ